MIYQIYHDFYRIYHDLPVVAILIYGIKGKQIRKWWGILNPEIRHAPFLDKPESPEWFFHVADFQLGQFQLEFQHQHHRYIIMSYISWASCTIPSPSHHHPSTVPEAKRLLATPGFIPALLAFVTSIAVTNVVGAFMDLVGDCAGIDPGRIWDETASMEYGIGVRRKFAASRCFHVFSRVIDTRTRKYESNIQSWSIPHFQTSPSYSYIFFHQVSIV